MVIPIHDRNPTKRFAVVTYVLILLNVAVYFFGPAVSSEGLPPDAPRACSEEAFIQHYAAVPRELTTNSVEETKSFVTRDDNGRLVPCRADYEKSAPLSALTSMFLHGGLLHLLGNMLFLYVFGNNVEDRLGRLKFLAFYLLVGYTAAYAFAFTQPDSDAPLVGASGAIAGVLGAYLWLFPKARVIALVPFLFFIPLPIPAWAVLSSWFILQAVYANGGGLGEGQVAYVAHVVGFAVGFVLAILYIGNRREVPDRPPRGRQSKERRRT
ncbi:MAG: rhomboid family intramembrane serine protease [Sporichthyaceae bacterium]